MGNNQKEKGDGMKGNNWRINTDNDYRRLEYQASKIHRFLKNKNKKSKIHRFLKVFHTHILTHTQSLSLIGCVRVARASVHGSTQGFGRL